MGKWLPISYAFENNHTTGTGIADGPGGVTDPAQVQDTFYLSSTLDVIIILLEVRFRQLLILLLVLKLRISYSISRISQTFSIGVRSI